MAMTNAAKILAGAALAVIAAVGAAHAQQQPRPASIYTVANVRAEAEAANAVEAKRLATETAETRAFQLLVSRLVDFRAAARIPNLPAAELERLISNIDVRGEGVSGTSYVATFGVTFSERSLAALLGQYGVVPVTDRGLEILIVPVFVEGGAAKTADRNPWRAALAGLDLTHALVPAKVAPVRGDITAAIASAYAANSQAGLDALKSQYHTTQILFALAEIEGGGDALTLKLIGSDALGAFALKRTLQPREGVDEAALQDAARLAFETVQERWKLTRGSPVSASAEPGAFGEPPSGYSPAGGELTHVLVTAEFSGIREWQAIRSRLQSVPGIQNWDLRSVNPRSAEISFEFPGGAERLAAIAARQGLSVENGPDGLIVRTR
jgi:hypothetical protein